MDKAACYQDAKETEPGAPVRAVVVLPTYNNATTVEDVLDRVAALGLAMVAVNDGSTDGTASRLAAWATAHQACGLIVLEHATNRGKAAAMQTGFAHASGMGYSHAITIDTDGQLDPEDIPKLLAKAEENPRALVVGRRTVNIAGYPWRSRVGRTLSNLGIRLASGVRVADSQCGLRVYPLGLIEAVRCGSGRYAFETEILARAGWAGCPVVEVPVTSRYEQPEGRVSHFRPIMDTVRGLLLQVRLLGRALSPWPHRVRWPERPQQRKRQRPVGWRVRRRRIWRWINPMQCWREIRAGEAGRLSTAAALGIGAFIANLPAYGFQTLMALYVARRLHLHPVAVVGGSNLSTPPIGPVLIASAIAVGHFLLNGSMPTLKDYDLTASADDAALLARVLLEWGLGSLIVGFVCMVLVTLGALAVFWLVPADKDAKADNG